VHHLRHRTATLSILVALALGVAACGSNTGSSSTTSSQTPTQGGTLKLLGSSDVDHLDTASAYYTASYTLERAFTRQLFSYPASADQTKAITPVPDLASELPTTANGGITANGKTYTIHLRQGVLWNTHPARAVTAADVVLGLKRLCNPVSPVGAPGYYTDTIVGMKAYCDGFAKVNGDAASIAAYINGHDVAGVKAVGDSTVVFTLLQPASDFLNILAMPFASPAPSEYLNYVPDSAAFRQHTISDGPYQIVSYSANHEIDLGRNPVWSQDTDPIRHQYVSRITITMGQDALPVQQQIQAGTADMEWDTVVAHPGDPRADGRKRPTAWALPRPGHQPVPRLQPAKPEQRRRPQERQGAAGH
jgi:peptide/nickel transport system substrate-binding protein